MAVIGIDLGCLYTKVGSVSKKGLQIVRNDLADRATPSLVTYLANQRLTGDAALSCMKSHALRTVRNFVHVLGCTNANSSVVATEEPFLLAPFAKQKESDFLSYDVGEAQPVLSVEVLVPYLEKLKAMSSAFLDTEVTKCVVATPLLFTDCNNDMIRVACKLAGLECLSTIPHVYATALNFGLFRRNSLADKEADRVAIVDVGYGQATVSVVDYRKNSYDMVVARESVELGSRCVDKLFVDHIIAAFEKQHGCAIAGNLKVRLKVAETAEKAKKVLSANKTANVTLECLFEDFDFDALFTREQFEALCAPYAQSLRTMLEEALAALPESKVPISSVQIAGGGTRIPFVVAAIEQVFGLPVSRKISWDECVALGAAIEAAIHDSRFRVARYDRHIVLQKPLGLILEQPLPGDAFDVLCKPLKVLQSDNGTQMVQLLEEHQKLGCRFEKTLYFPLAVQQKQFVFSVFCNFPVARFTVQIPDLLVKAYEEDAASCKFTVRLELQKDLRFAVRATFSQQVTVPEQFTEKVPKKDEEGNEIEGEFEEVSSTRQKTTNRQTNLSVENMYYGNYLTAQQIEDIRKHCAALAERDALTEKIQCAKNEILSESFRLRNLLDNPGEYANFITPATREQIAQLALEAEEFAEFNDSRELAPFAVWQRKLVTAWEPVKTRFRESRAEKFEQAAQPQDKNARSGSEYSSTESQSE